MTNEEAIAILEEEAEFLYGEDKPHNRTAFDMAIKALSVPEREKGEFIRIDDLDDTILRLNNDGWEITRSERKVIRNVLSEMPLYSFPDREKHYCKNCMFFNTVDIRNCVYVCGFKGGTVYGCECCEEWKGSAVPKREKGEWIEVVDEVTETTKTWHYECSECGKPNTCCGDNPHFCPNCGADMRGKGNDTI